ncbi:hypothetical protein FF098_006230 [Parvularcula flava]|uniref:Uncharacterized protein n=1 Tax=Aquisalinus luteolus TaxID=1566827 RepID=A0A8J3A1B6_9PROT|nr:hypothetical protein [Aquisalinus luteolus]NHK27497.1 hypothetical protein [Aquisalinus luteolus]GGH95616.1 hypothetical protein GCM10011355_12580 [Aquisalinus luteolus]
MRNVLEKFGSRTDGSIAVEAALVIALVLAPMLLYGVELYSYKSETAAMNRDSYSMAIALAATPDDTRTNDDIISVYRQRFPAPDNTITVDSYCTCSDALQSYTRNNAQNSCESACPSSTKIVWKKVTINRNYDAVVNSSLMGNKQLKASHLFRNS